jgi:hypothetical protein
MQDQGSRGASAGVLPVSHHLYPGDSCGARNGVINARNNLRAASLLTVAMRVASVVFHKILDLKEDAALLPVLLQPPHVVGCPW